MIIYVYAICIYRHTMIMYLPVTTFTENFKNMFDVVSFALRFTSFSSCQRRLARNRGPNAKLRVADQRHAQSHGLGR